LIVTDLAVEDELRLNVLLTQEPLAIRIDEHHLVLQALFENKESEIRLHPTCNEVKYLKRVRDLLSDYALDIPGGYPSVLNRWNRINQLRHEMIDPLLLLGDPEAVTAAVHAYGVTEDQAKRGWWAHPTAENALCLIKIPCVVESSLGQELANYLLEHLPFETEPGHQLDIVTQVLQPGLISDNARNDLWRRAQRNTTLMLGFVKADPFGLPAPGEAHEKLVHHQIVLNTLEEKKNPLSEVMFKTLSASGQRFITACRFILTKPADQEIVSELIDNIARFFNTTQTSISTQTTIEHIKQACEDELISGAGCSHLYELLEQAPDLTNEILAIRTLSQLDYVVVESVLTSSSATGALMQRKLAGVFDALNRELSVLNNTPLSKEKCRKKRG